jgi:hypothetical protein
LRRRSRKVRKSRSLTDQLWPYKGFPLSAHASGAWQKKIRGRVHYFGRWGQVENGKLERLPGDGWKDVLDQYEQQRDALHAGRTLTIDIQKIGQLMSWDVSSW